MKNLTRCRDVQKVGAIERTLREVALHFKSLSPACPTRLGRDEDAKEKSKRTDDEADLDMPLAENRRTSQGPSDIYSGAKAKVRENEPMCFRSRCVILRCTLPWRSDNVSQAAFLQT